MIMQDSNNSAEQSLTSRRDMLRAAGLGSVALLLAGCKAGSTDFLAPQTASFATVTADGITLDFSTDTDVLNYAYALEQLEAAFYVQVLASAGFSSIFSASEQRVLFDLREHEVAHRDFLAAALGSARIPGLTPNFSAVNFGSRTSVLETARTFEDLGVSAYNGAARYLSSAVLLGVAGKIVSVEARHAAAIRDLLSPRTPAFAPNAFDAGNTPQAVLTAADPFIQEQITAINT